MTTLKFISLKVIHVESTYIYSYMYARMYVCGFKSCDFKIFQILFQFMVLFGLLNALIQ